MWVSDVGRMLGSVLKWCSIGHPGKLHHFSTDPISPLYFLSREYTGLQAIAFCFLPPYLTEDAQRRIWPQRLKELFERRWAPAAADLAAKAGWTATDIDQLFTSAAHYFLEGPRRGFDGLADVRP